MKTLNHPWIRGSAMACLLTMGAMTTEDSIAQDNAGATLDEVVVTAERRTTNLQDTPVSVTAINADRIEEMHVLNIRELAAYVPNLNIVPSQYGDAAPNISIRGVGGGQALQSFGAASERNVAMYIDGLYYPRAFGSVLKVTEIAGVEVLRGPQGTLFGRNTTGGAISYTSRKASVSDGFSGFAEIEGGDWGLFNYKANINVPLGDKWAALAGAAKLKRDGYVERGGEPLNNDDTTAIVLNIHGEPLDRLVLDLNYSNTDSEGNGTPSNFSRLTWNDVPGDPTLGLRGHLGALSLGLVQQGEAPLTQNDPRVVMGRGEVPNYCMLDDANPFTMGALCDTFRTTGMNVVSLRAVYSLNDNLRLTSLTGSIDTDINTRTDSFYTGGYARDFSQGSTSLQQEFQVNFDYDNWHAVGGLIYFKEDANEREFTTERLMLSATDIPATLRTRRLETYDYNTKSYAAYGQASYEITDWWEVTGGLRYSEDRKEGHIDHVRNTTTMRHVYADGDRTWNSTDYRLAMQFRPTGDIMLFVSNAKAYKAGIANDASAEGGVPPGSEPVYLPMLWADPEEVVAWEGGVRSEWFNHRLRVNATYYDQDWSDRHTTQFAVVGDFLVIRTINSPGIINTQGVEIETLFAITNKLELNVNYGSTDATSSEDPNFVLDSVPRYNYVVGLRHHWDNLFGGSLATSLTYTYRASQYSYSVSEPDQDDPSLNPGYGLYNLNLSYTPDSGNWSLSLYGRNLADKEYTYGSFSISGYGLPSFAADNSVLQVDPLVTFYGAPRTIGAAFRYNF